jgi:glycosyltransferase involved in cell wall biosynthesis
MLINKDKTHIFSKMIFIAGSPLSGIGQVTSKYAQLMGNCPILTFEDPIPKGQDVFVFALPLPEMISKIKKIQKISKSVHCMCVCETETVHPVHEYLFELFKKIAVPSEFCKHIFSKQFPATQFEVIHHWIPNPPPILQKPTFEVPQSKYIFYHIGNVIDHRKQIKKIIETFLRLNLPDSLLILKATCNQPVNWRLPNVMILNGLLPDHEIQNLHKRCDCYVSFSHSEGVGMGAVEAALNNKPVILTEYGGGAEYVKTPYTIECGRCPVGVDDFLYTKDMEWGNPNQTRLSEFMKDAYEKKLSYMNHIHTQNLIDGVKDEFKTFVR